MHGGAGGRRQAHRAGFGRIRQYQRDIRRLRQRGTGARGDPHQRQGKTAGMGDKIGEFRGFTGIGQRQHRIPGHHHAEIAVRCLGGVHEHGRRAGGSEGGGDLVGDVSRFAHARNDNPAGCLGEQIHGAGKAVIQSGCQSAQRAGFGFQDRTGDLQIVRWVLANRASHWIHSPCMSTHAGRVNQDCLLSHAADKNRARFAFSIHENRKN